MVHKTEDDSISSADEAYEVATAPPPKKSKRGSQKKVITVPIGDGDGSRSRGEVYPPADSWSWRKYGQKPIKGSPYPRGYYRCSSSKGCPSRKQVERSCLDPTMLLITYTCEHNHPIPTSNKHHHHTPTAAATTRSAAAVVVKTEATDMPSTSTTSTSSTCSDIVPVKEEEDQVMVFDMDSDHTSGFRELACDMGWFSDVGSTMLDSQTLVAPLWMDADAAAVMLPIGEEDQSLFGDLGELPEYSMVFRRREVVGTTC